jgi:hypothetical protein
MEGMGGNNPSLLLPEYKRPESERHRNNASYVSDAKLVQPIR